MNYLEAYQARMLRNNNELLELIEQVIKKDPSIEAYYHEDKNRHVSSVVFFRGEYINSIGFHEVPYRWSGCGYGEFHGSHSGGDNVAMPFNADDVLKTFRAVTSVHHSHNTFFKSKAHYLGWCSYLKKHEPTVESPLI